MKKKILIPTYHINTTNNSTCRHDNKTSTSWHIGPLLSGIVQWNQTWKTYRIWKTKIPISTNTSMVVFRTGYLDTPPYLVCELIYFYKLNRFIILPLSIVNHSMANTLKQWTLFGIFYWTRRSGKDFCNRDAPRNNY